MASLRLLNALRRYGWWGRLRRLRGRVSPRVCTVIHGLVTRLPGRLTPVDLALKHHFDYHPVFISPRAVEHALPVGNWRRGRSASGGRFAGPLRWYTHGGGWKDARRHVTRSLHGRFVLDGGWDVNHRPFTVRPTIVELFVEGRQPHETAEYQKMRRWVEHGDFRWARGCKTAEDVDRYFDTLVVTYRSIVRDGYRTQQELGVQGGDEIRICIDRQGRPCVFGGGTHRLSIAQLLDLEQVPVVVKRVHARWVRACRDRYAGTVREAVEAGLRTLDTAPGDGPDEPAPGLPTPPVGAGGS